MADRRGLLIILSSPSGAGKSTLAKRLMQWDPRPQQEREALGKEHAVASAQAQLRDGRRGRRRPGRFRRRHRSL